jgi:hypothetical protein
MNPNLANQGCVSPQRISQVSEKMNKVEGSLSSLEVVINDLESRLQSILRPTGPECPPQPNKERSVEPVLVDLASGINSYGNRISLCEERLNSIISRIEL